MAATGLGGNASRVHEPRLPGVVTYGPYPMGGSVLVEVESNSGSSVAWVETSSIYSRTPTATSPGWWGRMGMFPWLRYNAAAPFCAPASRGCVSLPARPG